MTTDVKSKIEELEEEQRELKVKVGQVEAALDGHAAEPGEEARAKAFEQAGRYANSKLWPAAKLPGELASLRNDLGGLRNELGGLRNELAAEKNVAGRGATSGAGVAGLERCGCDDVLDQSEV